MFVNNRSHCVLTWMFDNDWSIDFIVNYIKYITHGGFYIYINLKESYYYALSC